MVQDLGFVQGSRLGVVVEFGSQEKCFLKLIHIYIYIYIPHAVICKVPHQK